MVIFRCENGFSLSQKIGTVGTHAKSIQKVSESVRKAHYGYPKDVLKVPNAVQ